jgi:hypothetical protein
MIDKPVMKPHSFSIIHRFNFENNRNFIGMNMQQLAAVQALHTNIPLCCANHCKDIRGEFHNE